MSTRIRYLHPEALYDVPYEAVELDTGPYQPLSGAWSATASDERGVDLVTTAGARARIDAVGEHVLRLRLVPAGKPGPSLPEELGLVDTAGSPTTVTVVDRPDGWGLATAAASLHFDGDGNLLFTAGDEVLTRSQGPVRFSEEAPEFARGHRFLADFELGDERILGFGGRILPPDRTHTTCDLFAMKVGAHSGDYGGFPQPWFLSTRGYGVFLCNPWPHVYFDMGRSDPGRWWLHAPGGECDLFFVHGPNIRDIVRRFTALVGRVPPPERWQLGYWCSSLSFKHADEVLAYARRFRRAGLPLAAMVLDGPWRGGPEFLEKYMSSGEYPSNDLDWHPDFGDGTAMVAALGDLGVRTVLHQNSRTFGRETSDEGESRGFLRREDQELVVRLGEATAEEWYAGHLRPRHREGLGGWWLDHGDRVSGALAPGMPSRNLFGSLWGRLVAERMAADTGNRPLVLIRGAGIGGQRHALPWPGDTRFGIDFFAEDIWFCLNAGLSGFPITSADLGGFYDRRADKGLAAHNCAFDEENLARRVCQSLMFLPTPRVHADDSALPKVPWHCPPAIERLYTAFLRERDRLTPWFIHHAWLAHRHGDPILRPLAWEWPERPEALAAGEVFLIGEHLLCAPVCTHGARERALWLPPGIWTSWWSGERFEGDRTITVPTPLFETHGLPLLVRDGAILPTQEPGADAEGLPRALDFHAFGEPPQDFRLEEDGNGTTAVTLTGHGSVAVANPHPWPRAWRLFWHRADGRVVVASGTSPAKGIGTASAQ